MSIALLGTCASCSTTAVGDSAPTPASGAIGSSLEALIIEQTGSSLSELAVRAEAARFELVAACLEEEGFRNLEPPPPDLDNPPLPANVADQYLALLEDAAPPTTFPVDKAVEFASASYQQAAARCAESAEERVADPAAPYRELLALYDAEINQRALGDPAHQESLVVQERCLGDLGYTVPEAFGTFAKYVTLANEAFDGFLNGQLDEAEATHRLAEIAADEADATPALWACVDAQQRTLLEVRAEIEADFADRNSEVVRAMLRETKDAEQSLPD